MSTTTLERKAFTAEVKAAEDGEPGSFTGYAAIFGNVDSFGDVMDPVSFDRTLSERGLPMLAWMHEWDLVGPIGVVVNTVETAHPDGNLMVFSSPEDDMTVIWVFGFDQPSGDETRIVPASFNGGRG